MTQPGWNNHSKQQSGSGGFFVWLGGNIIPVGVLLVLIAMGTTAYLALRKPNHKKTPDEAEKPGLNLKEIREAQAKARDAYTDCRDQDIHCRQIKRIKADGGASPEAVRKNLLEADRSVTFEQIREDAAKYEGMPWAFEGKIHDIIGEEKRGIGDYILAEIRVGDDPGKLLAVRGDFKTDFQENDTVYVVGYLTGTSRPRLGPSALKYPGLVVGMSARAFLKPIEAREILLVAR